MDIYKNRHFIWLHRCISRFLFTVKASSHWLPLYGFSTVWILWCISRFWYWYKHLSTLAALLWLLPSVSSLVYFETLFYCESLHTNCIYMTTQVWVLLCISRLLFTVKASSHCLPLYGFYTMWVIWLYLNKPIETIKNILKYII